MSGLVEVLRQHLPRDRCDDEGHSTGTFCTCGGWAGDYFADGEAGPFDDHLAAAIEDHYEDRLSDERHEGYQDGYEDGAADAKGDV